MPSSNTPFTVAGDLDKITGHAPLAGFEWAPVYAPRPNRVIARFSDKAQAQAAFDYMKAQGMPAFKNWLE
jgi:hypothetical protein